VHRTDDEKGDAEEHPLVVEDTRHDERPDEHRGQRDEQRGADDGLLRVERVRQRRIGRPRPPEGAEHEHTTADPGEGRIGGKQRRDLRECEDEDEVEEELSRRDVVLEVACRRHHRPRPYSALCEVGGPSAAS
jgi:hypothetical protein